VIQFIHETVAAAHANRRPVVSFEFFPTKTEEGERALLEKTIPALRQLHPDFCSVTYGAGGSTRGKTLAIVDRIQRDQHLPSMAHLTCVNTTRDQVAAVLEDARALGIRNILALRGDPPSGTSEWATDGCFEYSYQLVRFIREAGGFSIGVAGFPEGHIACTEGRHADWHRLKKKIDHGADFVITQLFFRNSDYFECRDFLAGQGVTVPIIPGILPILSTSQIKRFVALCGATLPTRLLSALERCGDDDDAVTRLGIEYATTQCEELLREGAPGLHFYTLNKAGSTTAVVKNLGLQKLVAGEAGTHSDRFDRDSPVRDVTRLFDPVPHGAEPPLERVPLLARKERKRHAPSATERPSYPPPGRLRSHRTARDPSASRGQRSR
jgi:methylenetetrahydrofolate reductase (NADPH)